MKLKIYRNESPDTAFDYCYIIIGSFYDKQHSVEIHDNSIVIKDFENFVYWFEQQIYYLTYEQFKKIEVAKRDIIDDLKDVINRYEFYRDEVRRCYYDMEEYEAKIDLLETQKMDLVEALANKTWQDMRQTAFKRRQARKWHAH